MKGKPKSDSTYLQRYALGKEWINSPPSADLSIVVVIPALAEPDLPRCLECLKSCQSPGVNVEVITVINDSSSHHDSVKKQNKLSFELAEAFAVENETTWIRFFNILATELDPKTYGVGLARKIGMDEAVRRLAWAGRENGIIVGLDADCGCSSNYLKGIWEYFLDNPKAPGASIYFEHPITENINSAFITLYELHLRYFINAQKWAGFNGAFHTVGSCMAVRSNAYQKVGGMNRRQAGEDFHFLHKVIKLGGYGAIGNISVYPSARQSERVPFGTGRSMIQQSGAPGKSLTTYNPASFKDLKTLLGLIPDLYNNGVAEFLSKKPLPGSVQKFVGSSHFQRQTIRLIRETAGYESFLKRFSHYFDGFRVMKFLHYARDNFHPNVPVSDASQWLLQKLDIASPQEMTDAELLKRFRELDRMNT